MGIILYPFTINITVIIEIIDVTEIIEKHRENEKLKPHQKKTNIQ